MGMPRKKSKSPPVMSHEFVIQNHADILACIAIFIVAGLLTERTSRLSKLFIHLQYGIAENTTDADSDVDPSFKEFNRGFLDIFTLFFGSLMLAVFHAVLQEYVIDKGAKRLHLSKMKTSKFNESGHLVVWCLVSAAWGLNLIYEAGFHRDITLLWQGYPHTVMDWGIKIYFLAQLGYWLHLYPELYFLKVRKEDIPSRIQDYSLHLGFIAGAYILHFWKIALVLLTLHYISMGVFHASRIFYYAEKKNQAAMGFNAWRIVFYISRVGTILLCGLTFTVGLGSAENKGLDIYAGNFNSFVIRTSAFASVLVSQVWLFVSYFQLMQRRAKETEQSKEPDADFDDEPEFETKPKRTPRTRKNKSEKSTSANPNGLTTRSRNKAKKN